MEEASGRETSYANQPRPCLHDEHDKVDEVCMCKRHRWQSLSGFSLFQLFYDVIKVIRDLVQIKTSTTSRLITHKVSLESRRWFSREYSEYLEKSLRILLARPRQSTSPKSVDTHRSLKPSRKNFNSKSSREAIKLLRAASSCAYRLPPAGKV